ncbi:hypothetical protein PVAP13_4NG171611 [Panicum virgatum]|uniref:Uncharacterized protein n=1 Tax=Panicum virgatum TaxID=38727 RepID=A0A8T0TBA7_PANVG|nr:hypothetical protein PVAP13_4NG171611 [Panicum virgatum]
MLRRESVLLLAVSHMVNWLYPLPPNGHVRDDDELRKTARSRPWKRFADAVGPGRQPRPGPTARPGSRAESRIGSRARARARVPAADGGGGPRGGSLRCCSGRGRCRLVTPLLLWTRAMPISHAREWWRVPSTVNTSAPARQLVLASRHQSPQRLPPPALPSFSKLRERAILR